MNEYAARFEFDLGALEPMVALPGDPCNGVPLSAVGDVRLQKGFIGSCTGGKLEDLRAADAVLRGRRVADGVQLYVQAASRTVYERASNLDRTYFSHASYRGVRTVPVAIAGTHGGGRLQGPRPTRGDCCIPHRIARLARSVAFPHHKQK